MMRIPWAWGAGYQLLISENDVIRRRSLFSLRDQDRAGPTDVIDAHHQHNRIDTRTINYVPVETGERILAHAVAQYAGA